MREEALDWLESALVDLNEAREACRRGSYHLALFLAHQAVEKALKAYIIGFKRKLPPRSHDLVELLSLAELQLNPQDFELVSELSPYYVVARYPNAGLRKPWIEIRQGTAQRLLSVAERVVNSVKTLFEQAKTS
ncbi:MAG: HEPN domain-containing protein [Desulfurococcaceae archaeon]